MTAAWFFTFLVQQFIFLDIILGPAFPPFSSIIIWLAEVFYIYHPHEYGTCFCALDWNPCCVWVKSCGPSSFDNLHHPSIHPSTASMGIGSRGQQLEQRNPDVPVPSHFLQLFRGDPKAFPGQPRDIRRIPTVGTFCSSYNLFRNRDVFRSFGHIGTRDHGPQFLEPF